MFYFVFGYLVVGILFSSFWTYRTRVELSHASNEAIGWHILIWFICWPIPWANACAGLLGRGFRKLFRHKDYR